MNPPIHGPAVFDTPSGSDRSPGTNRPPTADPAHDLLHYARRPLDVFFSPHTVAVVGATETVGSVGRTLFQNLITSPFGGMVFPVNPKRASVLGVKAYPSIAALPDRPDLAVIATPAPTVPDVVRECARAGVRGAVIISAGFKESGPEGEKLEQEILAIAREAGMRLIGPNCLGVMSPVTGLNATFAQTIAHPGNVAFVSQSGALCTAILDWSLRELVGFSAFLSIGSMLDVGWGDLIDHLGNDPQTACIILYMESIGDARSFLSAAREVAFTKPIIVIKAGRTEVGARAAASHTGSLTGSDEVLDAAFRRCGVLRVERIANLFFMADVLARQPRPKGPRLSILTNAGGPGVLAADALIANGGQLAELSEQTVGRLDQLLPPHWSHHNPIDVLGDAGPDRYAKTLEIAAEDPNSDGLLVILTPQAMTDPTETAEQLRPYARVADKPVLASWMGGPDVAAGQNILNSAGIPVFPYPDTAALMFQYMWRYTQNLRSLYETPSLPPDSEAMAAARDHASTIIEEARKAGRTLLTEVESKDLLSTYAIPTVPTAVAPDAESAVRTAEEFGYPVVLKLYSTTITHKTDVGGVQLNLRDAAAVRAAYESIEISVREKAGAGHFQGVTVQPMMRLDGYELILGSSIDPQFGPVLLFGSGGQLVEVTRDRSLALPPLNSTLARRMMERTRVFTALQGVRGRAPVDIAALEQLLVRFSQLVVEQRWIKEIDINPLLASPERLIALDARVVLYDSEVTEDQLPPLAIRPYPRAYVKPWRTRSGTEVTFRPIRPEDEPLMVRFHEALSDRSVYLYYFHTMNLSSRTAHDRLIRICFNDYDREIALVVDQVPDQAPDQGSDHLDAREHQIIGVARLSKIPHTGSAEFAMLVQDQYQGQGLGAELLRQLLDIARHEKIQSVIAHILRDNLVMQRLCEAAGFRLTQQPGGDLVLAEIQL